MPVDILLQNLRMVFLKTKQILGLNYFTYHFKCKIPVIFKILFSYVEFQLPSDFFLVQCTAPCSSKYTITLDLVGIQIK